MREYSPGTPQSGILFHALAGLMGLVELGSMEMFPCTAAKSRFTNREVAEYLKKGLAKSLLDVTFKGIVGTGGEAVEEGAQSGLEDGFTNALKAMANKDGADLSQSPGRQREERHEGFLGRR